MEKIMKKIKTQKELVALCKRGIKEGEEYEIIGSGLEMKADLEVFGFVRVSVYVKMGFSSKRIVLRGSSHAELRGSSHAELRESSHAELWGSSVGCIWSASLQK